ncbi:hypothetical protein [Shewanella phaeophyticola]|uniref:Lipoprotein n=1 Tax=Shewanella phaeophyticola TaxID=2978345 RepID=A0ABT2P5K8_9GAMM|nr:hypothetical protein [Shewanella sp. KJ10-1]MCT8987651.1 hypothetical protein [Shewanella sp. KJ10-1]
MRKILFIMIIYLIQGCGSLANTYLPDAVMADNDEDIPYFNDNSEIILSVNDIATLNSNSAKRKAFIAQAILSSDKKCIQHQANIISNANSWNVGMGSLSMLLTGTAAVISHAQTAAELAAAATAVTGIQSMANEEIYANAMGTAIIRAIDVSRAKSLAIIDQKILTESTDSAKVYTTENALVDIQRYHSQCSLMAGLVEITKALEQRKLSTHEVLLKKKQLEANINAYTAQLVAQNNAFTPTQADTDKQKKDLSEMNERLKALVLQSVESPE